ncbi:GNAT family N-acetyltransferase [Spirosoma knui]
MFKVLYADSISLHLINQDNLADVHALFQGYPDSDELLVEIAENYLPRYVDGKRTNYGFYTTLNDELAGLSLLSIDSWRAQKGSTGADTLMHMRGRGVAPRSKPHLFYLAFALLGLNRVETGCFVSNLASKRSIEKTVGFRLEGVMRESGLNDHGEFEDEYLYAILRKDWLTLYDKTRIELVY